MALLIPDLIIQPFANGAGLDDITSPPQTDGSGFVNFTNGYTPFYEISLTANDPLAKAVDRQTQNYLFNAATKNAMAWQGQGLPAWYAGRNGGYGKGSQVLRLAGGQINIYRSLVEANIADPVGSANWEYVQTSSEMITNIPMPAGGTSLISNITVATAVSTLTTGTYLYVTDAVAQASAGVPVQSGVDVARAGMMEVKRWQSGAQELGIRRYTARSGVQFTAGAINNVWSNWVTQVTLDYLQSGLWRYGHTVEAATPATNSYAVTITPPWTIGNGTEIAVAFHKTNTGAASLNVNGSGAFNIMYNISAPLVGGELNDTGGAILRFVQNIGWLVVSSYGGTTQAKAATANAHLTTLGQVKQMIIDGKLVDVTWANILNKPTTRDGYGLTDVLTTTQVNALVAPKANTIDVTNALALKADKTYVDQQLGLKSNTIDVTNALALKADKTYVDQQLDTKANKATTLAGYNVPVATQTQAQSGTDNVAPITGLSVLQAIQFYVKQATTAITGVARLATQAEVTAGGDNATIVTPLTLSGRGDAGAYNANTGVVISTNGIDTLVSIQCTSVFVSPGGGRGIYVAGGFTASMATNGVNAIDTGAAQANAWYNVYVINGSGSTASILSLNASSPTLPPGYVRFARIGCVRTGPIAGYPKATLQRGNTAVYKINKTGNTTQSSLAMITGIQGDVQTPTYVATSVDPFVPPTAISIGLTLAGHLANTSSAAAPNPNYIGVIAGTLGAPLHISQGATNATMMAASGSFLLETRQVFFCSQAPNGGLYCTGWVDNV